MENKVGIVAYGIFVPKTKISMEEICDTWSVRPPGYIKASYGVNGRAVSAWDEDAITMAIDAAKAAFDVSEVPPSKIGAIYLGTCTNPYTTKASSTTVAEGLGIGPEVMCADVQFSGKSGTACIQICMGLVKSGIIDYGLAIGSDVFSRHVAPNDLPLEYLASAGAAAYIIGKEKLIAEIESTYSFSTETPDFFRLDGDRYLKRGVSSAEEDIGYMSHIVSAVNSFMNKNNYKPADFDYAVYHQPDAVRPAKAAQKSGFASDIIEKGLIADRIGDCASANALIGLAAVLDQAKPNERILLASYGYGGGSDVFSMRTTELIGEKRGKAKFTVEEALNSGTLVDYKTYIKMERKFIQEYV